jgi:glycosyltransferase involved in cell wall biosynthesis
MYNPDPDFSMNNKKIAFLIHGLVVGGAEKFFISLVNNSYRRGLDPLVILLSSDNALFHEMDAGVRSVIIERSFKYDLTVGKKVRSVLKENEIDTVFCVGMFSFFLMKLYLRSGGSTRFILSLHSTIPRSFRDYLMNLVYFRAAGREDRILFICKAQQDYLRKHYGFKPRNARIIYNGIDTSYFTPDAASAALPDTIPAGEKIILKVARMFREKGHQYAIRALEVLHQSHQLPAHLLFVGSGDEEYEKEIRGKAAASPVGRYIHFIRHQADVRPFLKVADVFTLTSYTTETFSLAALEALSSGVPCSLTHIGGAAEMINASNGALSESKNVTSIAETWHHILTRQYDKNELHRFVADNFSLPVMLENYRQELQS